MKRVAIVGVYAALAAGSYVSPVHAFDWWDGRQASAPLGPGQVWLSVGGNGGVWHVPRVRAYGLYDFAGATADKLQDLDVGRVRITGAGMGSSFGYIFRDGTVPAWLGTKFRIGLHGAYREGDSRTLHASARNGTGASTPTLNLLGQSVGLGPSSLGGNSGSDLSVRLKSSSYELAARLASDFAVTRNLTLAPSIGVFGGSTSDRYRLDEISFSGAANAFVTPNSIDARIHSRRIGGEFGMDATLQADSMLAFHFGARIGLFHVRGALDATDCVSASAFVGQGQTCPGGGQVAFSSLSESRDAFGFRVGGSLGATLNMSFATLGLGGFASFDNKTPGFRGPTAQGFNFAGGAAFGAEPARVVFGGHVSYGGYLNVRIALGGQ